MPAATECVMGMVFFGTHIQTRSLLSLHLSSEFSNIGACWSVYFWQFHIVPYRVWCCTAIQSLAKYFINPISSNTLLIRFWSIIDFQNAIFITYYKIWKCICCSKLFWVHITISIVFILLNALQPKWTVAILLYREVQFNRFQVALSKNPLLFLSALNLCIIWSVDFAFKRIQTNWSYYQIGIKMHDLIALLASKTYHISQQK